MLNTQQYELPFMLQLCRYSLLGSYIDSIKTIKNENHIAFANVADALYRT
jgi:hypothetical protein